MLIGSALLTAFPGVPWEGGGTPGTHSCTWAYFLKVGYSSILPCNSNPKLRATFWFLTVSFVRSSEAANVSRLLNHIVYPCSNVRDVLAWLPTGYGNFNESRDPTTSDPDVCVWASLYAVDHASSSTCITKSTHCMLSGHDDGKVTFTIRYLCECHWLE